MSDHVTIPAAPEDTSVVDRFAEDDGMTSAEYAVGTVASCGFAGLLYEIVQSNEVHKLILKVITKAFSLFF